MNDAEIIKAFQKCTGDEFSKCDGCPFSCSDMDCDEIEKYVLEIVKRYKAEIERLTDENKRLFDNWLILEKRTKERYAELYEEAKGVVKSEAIKEFAERLRKRLDRKYTIYGREYVLRHIREVVKEMTEGEK